MSGTVETYYQSDRLSHGFSNVLSWVELNARLNSNLKGTFSITDLRFKRVLDEFNVQYETGGNMIRAGRMRISFGFSNWSELFYTGYNHTPIVRSANLVDKTRLNRDDAGIEITTGGPNLQIQAAVVDSRPSDFQVAPKRIRYGSVRVQSSFGPVIAAIDALPSLDGNGSIYGLDLRWTSPHIVAKAEYMKGVGDGPTAQGYYGDVAYRLPGLPRTQLVSRTEWLDRSNGGEFRLHTFGAKQIVTQNLTVNVNYGWGTGKAPAFVENSPSLGWSLRALFQVHF
ncbi:hypothetical protein OP10G_0720 [Fimbriimonas ginsengisoli Gsoil 348]|uniref:Phosphate-selective porin O and P n=1 Tax=Fimbriimonas ginsengisoli Gsoil 348 TaxID=661478 RepID=A0A068NKL2_FIMGI|nr:hypothetical protein OP10G_0720 [Fimbriimonas ginsengisoli Gsoil 348]